jgi:hypothetical protein
MYAERDMVVDFSHAELSMTIKGITTFNLFSADAALINDKIEYTNGQPDEETHSFFGKVGARIRKFAQDHKGKLAVILLTGRGVNERFKQTSTNATVDSMTAEGVVEPSFTLFEGEDTTSDMIFVPVKGAAEIAKRRLERPV